MKYILGYLAVQAIVWYAGSQFGRKGLYCAIFFSWFMFSLGICMFVSCQAARFLGCTREATNGVWTASVHSDVSCEDAQRRADAFLHDHDYEVRGQ